jgi:PAS domain S-box-containing protein
LFIALSAGLIYFLMVRISSSNRDQLRLQATALNAAANAIVITDAVGTILWVNPAFTAITGYAPEEVTGRKPNVLKSGQHDQQFYQALWNTIKAGRVWHGEMQNRHKDGHLYSEEMTIAPVRSHAGAITHFVAIKQDVTERKSLESQLQQVRKLEAVGRLAGGGSHDFNNMLGVIIGYGDILETQLPPGHPALKNAAEMQKAARRAADLTRQLLAFSRRQILQPQVVNLDSLIEELSKMLRRLIGEDIELVFLPGQGVARVKADPGQLEQVVMNLAVNARDAMPSGGRLSIETANVNVDGEFCHRHPPMQPGSYVRLSVSDTGAGMNAETLARIFEPFFTTKEQGKGTGLGLSIVYGIVKQSGGYIWVDSAPHHGTTFQIYLPPTTKAEATVTSQAPRQAPIGGTETILVVEDDSSLREMIRTVLTAAGYRVLEAPNGAEALSLLRGSNQPVHLLITDIIMPGQMNGWELSRAASINRADIRALFITGFGVESNTFGIEIDPDVMLLTKPFGSDLLLRKIREALDNHAGAKSAATSL